MQCSLIIYNIYIIQKYYIHTIYRWKTHKLTFLIFTVYTYYWCWKNSACLLSGLFNFRLTALLQMMDWLWMQVSHWFLFVFFHRFDVLRARRVLTDKTLLYEIITSLQLSHGWLWGSFEHFCLLFADQLSLNEVPLSSLAALCTLLSSASLCCSMSFKWVEERARACREALKKSGPSEKLNC